MAKKKKSLGNGALVLIALLVFAISGGCTYLYLTRNNRSAGAVQVEKPHPLPPVVSVTEDVRKVTIFVPESGKDSFYLVPVTRTAKAKGDILDAALEVLVATNKEKGEIGSLIPHGTRILSPVKVADGVATIDLSGDFIANFSGGSDQEALTLNSIAHTLVKNSEGKVSKVRILVEGEPAESLGEHLDLTQPIVPSSTMLKPGT